MSVHTVPKSWDTGEIKKFKRDRRSKTILLIVLKGNKEHRAWSVPIIRLVKRNASISAWGKHYYCRKASAFWGAVVDTDPDRAYTRAFLNEWLEGTNSAKPLIAPVMLDLDHFKNVNDTYVAWCWRCGIGGFLGIFFWNPTYGQLKRHSFQA